MATSLFKMPFDSQRLKVQRVYASTELAHCQVETMSCEKIREIYGELKFLELHEDRPCTYTSLVTSLDGRIAFTDAPQGPLIAKKNKYDPAGADTDWFILNMLRAVSDGVMLGAGTMNAESEYTCHVFDQDMENMRIENGKNPVPWNIVTSLDATDIPFDHVLFNTPEVPVMISTSRKGMELVRKNIQNDACFVDVPSIESVTEEMIQSMRDAAGKVLVIGTGDTAPDSKVALYVLKKFGIDRLLVETPSYMHYLVSQKMMDELFFNYSCIYVGGQALTIGKFGKEFTSEDHPHTRMLSIHTHSDHFFYFRHKLLYD